MGNTLYFVNGNTGIYKYTPGDAKATLVTSNASVHALIADSQWLYFQGDYGDATLWKVSLTGGSPKGFALLREDCQGRRSAVDEHDRVVGSERGVPGAHGVADASSHADDPLRQHALHNLAARLEVRTVVLAVLSSN